jgi:Deoxyxylulose-5-phosphate synthase
MLVEKINSPRDIKSLRINELQELSKEIRDLIIEVVSKTGGHLASNLGVVELTLALHYVFDFSKDKLIFDVSHQAYAHKIITGRRENFYNFKNLRRIERIRKSY